MINAKCICGAAYKFPDEKAGKKMKCGKCSGFFSVPLEISSAPLAMDRNEGHGNADELPVPSGGAEWTDTELEKIGNLKQAYDRLLPQIRKAVVGQNKVVRQVLIGLFAQGHCLLVGVPGLAKTLLVRTLSSTLSLKFKRIQFTPDLMPSDITGTEIIEENKATGERSFRFVPGPIFTHMLLADEINRTPPKTQAALLEAMEERRVTVGGVTRDLERPFFVLATQNPIEQEGTYPLPEAQLDRFMFQIKVHYPSEAEEESILLNTTSGQNQEITPVLAQQEIIELQQLVRKVNVPAEPLKLILRLVRATRISEPGTPAVLKKWLSWGAGPRAGQYLILGAKAIAALDGRPAIKSEDVLDVVEAVLGHRLVLNFAAQAEGVGQSHVVAELVKAVS
jgi:MoxR-like ATPase